jgi:hypothetical protein
MKSFREIALEEKVLNWTNKNNTLADFLQGAMDEAKKLMKYDIVYRGFGNGKTMAGVAFVENDRNSFYGSLDDNASKLLKEIGVKNPAFGARSKEKASIFGAVYTMVPKGKFTALQSSIHDDLVSGFRDKEVTDKDIKDIASSYKKTLSNINDSEIIFDTKEYYLLEMNYLLRELDKGNKFQKHTGESIKTYADLYYALKSFISFSNFKNKNRR